MTNLTDLARRVSELQGKEERRAAVRIADRFAQLMASEGVRMVIAGDQILGNHDFIKGHAGQHPWNRMQATLDALGRAPDLFAKSYTYAHDLKGRPCKVRSFRLIARSEA